MKTTAAKFQVSEETGLFLETLQALSATSDAFLAALQKLYGEKQGEQAFNGYADAFMALERAIGDELRASIVDNMSTVPAPDGVLTI